MTYKGSWKRRSGISNEEEQLRYDLAFGKITLRDFNIAMAKIRQPHKDYLDEQNKKDSKKAD